MTDGRAGGGEPAGFELEHSRRPATRQANPPWLQLRHTVDDDAAAVEGDDVDRKTHAAGVNAAAGNDPERLAGIESAARQESDSPIGTRRGHADPVRDDGPGARV